MELEVYGLSKSYVFSLDLLLLLLLLSTFFDFYLSSENVIIYNFLTNQIN